MFVVVIGCSTCAGVGLPCVHAPTLSGFRVKRKVVYIAFCINLVRAGIFFNGKLHAEKLGDVVVQRVSELHLSLSERFRTARIH